MDFLKLNSLVLRVFFTAAFALLALSVLELVVNFVGYTVLRGSYAPGRLIEFAGIFVVFVIALLLRQIREEQKTNRN